MRKLLFKSLGVLMAFVLIISQTLLLSAKTVYLGLPGIDESAFTLNEGSLNAAMQDLNELESYLDQNEGVTYADLAASGSSLINNVSDSSYPMGMKGEYDDILGIPPFLWGCVLGWVGVLLVSLMSDGDKTLVQKSVYGACVSTTTVLIVILVMLLSTDWDQTGNDLEGCFSYVFNSW